MSTLQPPTFRFPFALRDQPHEVQQAHIFAFNAVLDLQRAIGSLKGQINNITTTASTTSTTTEISVGGGSLGTSFPGLGGVNDQTGNTAYTVSAGDNGVLLILNDASPVAVTLNSGLTPPYFIFITNFGAGTVTLTPTAGTINGAGSLALLTNESIWCVFNGTNWKTDAFFAPPVTLAKITHQWLDSYTATTGAFTQSQPAFTDISGSLATGQLPASVPVVSFGSGAPVGSSTEGYLYFDTSGSPYHGYVWHSAAWHQFS
jgi:hypothetical protein